MATAFRPRTLILFIGDLVFLVASLWVALFLRTMSAPDQETFMLHLLPFLIIFILSVGVFFIAGLYESRSIILARRAFSVSLLIAQSFNVAFAALFFFFTPIFGIAPKTILLIYLGVSFLFILLWRVGIFPWFGLQKPEQAIVVGERTEVMELVKALGEAHRAPARVGEVVSPESPTLGEDIIRAINKHHARFVIADFNDPRVASAFPGMYNFLASGIRFFDALSLYETVFGRIPLSKLDDRWLAQNVSFSSHPLHDSLKRAVDIGAAILLLPVFFVCYPLFALVIKLQDGGPVLYRQVRVGQHNRPTVMYKFRSMSGTDQGSEVLKSKHVVTPFGKFLRVSRLDEFPQVWNLLKGDLSLIGPRPEFPALVAEYERQIPYYGIRHLVKPGLSGWAQLYHDNHPHHGTGVEATREKLSYDLYYLKHRSLVLDVVIALKTLKKLITRSGV